MTEAYQHTAYALGFEVERDDKVYRPAGYSRWALLLMALGLRQMPQLYVDCQLASAIKRTADVMAAREIALWPAPNPRRGDGWAVALVRARQIEEDAVLFARLRAGGMTPKDFCAAQTAQTVRHNRELGSHFT